MSREYIVKVYGDEVLVYSLFEWVKVKLLSFKKYKKSSGFKATSRHGVISVGRTKTEATIRLLDKVTLHRHQGGLNEQ